jgi:hypothetical protein
VDIKADSSETFYLASLRETKFGTEAEMILEDVKC